MRIPGSVFRTLGKVLPLCVALPLAGCGLGELDDFAPLTVFDNFHVIEFGQAYRSAQLDAESFRLVIDVLGIQTVINLRGENEDELWYQREQAAVAEAGATLVDIRMSASELPSRENLLLLYDTFLETEYPILIHCQAGADRAGAAAAIWRMVVLGEPRELAALQLSPLYGHFVFVHPQMDYLVAIFEPDRDWIENEYPVP
ncbi:MAG TPA: tyrosine-protein phosphatase [Phycisphaerae bacterium]|nr:tyrosine-protein phosphatase [Phycisphaerae bacterium]